MAVACVGFCAGAAGGGGGGADVGSVHVGAGYVLLWFVVIVVAARCCRRRRRDHQCPRPASLGQVGWVARRGVGQQAGGRARGAAGGPAERQPAGRRTGWSQESQASGLPTAYCPRRLSARWPDRPRLDQSDELPGPAAGQQAVGFSFPPAPKSAVSETDCWLACLPAQLADLAEMWRSASPLEPRHVRRSQTRGTWGCRRSSSGARAKAAAAVSNGSG